MLPNPWTPERVKELRDRLGMTQTAFAAAVGVSSLVIVSRWECGTRTPDKRSREALERLDRPRKGPGR